MISTIILNIPNDTESVEKALSQLIEKCSPVKVKSPNKIVSEITSHPKKGEYEFVYIRASRLSDVHLYHLSYSSMPYYNSSKDSHKNSGVINFNPEPISKLRKRFR